MSEFEYECDRLERFYRDVSWVALYDKHAEEDVIEKNEVSEFQEIVNDDNRERARDMMKEIGQC